MIYFILDKLIGLLPIKREGVSKRFQNMIMRKLSRPLLETKEYKARTIRVGFNGKHPVNLFFLPYLVSFYLKTTDKIRLIYLLVNRSPG